MTMTCISTPVSWLKLEGYQLGELAAAEVGSIESHLRECGACRTCADELAADTRTLAPLPALPAGKRVSWQHVLRWQAWLPLLGTGAAAAAAFFFAFDSSAPTDHAPARIAIKGGDVAMELVRERDGVIASSPDRFADEDRFKILFTCPAPATMRWDVAVYQDGERYHPLAASELACRNRAALPGAFRLTGTQPATVCVWFSTHASPQRAQLGESVPSADSNDAVCVTVTSKDGPLGD